jgi:hypothetical protein
MRENLHAQVSAADISQTERQSLKRTACGHVWLKDLAVEQSGRGRIFFRRPVLGSLRQVREMPAEARGISRNTRWLPRKWEDS